ncbi:MAG: FtsX-like permease family protein [Planctomycetota bacterium]
MSAIRTPLAWKNLTHDRRRLAAAVVGIGFAVLLMFLQVGFENALFNSQVRLLDRLAGDVFLISRARFALAAEKRFPIERLNQARSCAGVEAVAPVYLELTTSVLKNVTDPRGGRGYPIRAIGVPLDRIGGAPVVRGGVPAGGLDALRRPRVALIDSRSKASSYDFPLDDPAELSQTKAELAGQAIRFAGVFDLGPDFVNDGSLLMSTANFAAYFPRRNPNGPPLDVVDLAVVTVSDNARPAVVRDRLAAVLGPCVVALTRGELRRREVRFWRRSTPIGTIFWAGKVIGFVVGVVICYQVIFSGIADHLPEFATLKAMGYGAAYFVSLIIAEAALLTLFGFVPGAAISTALYGWLAGQTGLLMTMTPGCLALVLAVTLVMCIVSGLLAVRKLLAADPASLF